MGWYKSNRINGSRIDKPGKHHYWQIQTTSELDLITRLNHDKTMTLGSPIDSDPVKMSRIMFSKACRAAAAPNVFFKA